MTPPLRRRHRITLAHDLRAHVGRNQVIRFLLGLPRRMSWEIAAEMEDLERRRYVRRFHTRKELEADRQHRIAMRPLLDEAGARKTSQEAQRVLQNMLLAEDLPEGDPRRAAWLALEERTPAETWAFQAYLPDIKAKGRPRGTGFRDDDLALCPMIHDRVTGKNGPAEDLKAVCLELASSARGGGTLESKAKRLERVYREWRRKGDEGL